MTAILTGVSDIPIQFQGWYDRALLTNVQNVLLYDKWGADRLLRKNMGNVAVFRRYNLLASNTTPLQDGVTPAGKKLSTTEVECTIYFYGDFVTLTDQLILTGLDPNLMNIAENQLSMQASDSLDLVYRNKLITGTTVRLANDVAARTSIGTAISDTDCEAIIRTLEGNKARKHTKMKTAGPNYGQKGIRAAYIGITHTHSRKDVEALKGFTPVAEYPSQDALSQAQGEIIEIGEAHGIRWLATTNCKMWGAGGVAVGSTGMKADDSTNVDVYGTLIFGREAYGVVPIEQGKIRNIIKALGSAGTEDPLDQRATSGWKAGTGVCITQEEWMVRYEHAVTAL